MSFDLRFLIRALFGLGLLVLSGIGFLYLLDQPSTRSVLENAYWSRYSLLMVAFLVVFPFVAYWGFPSSLYGLLVLEGQLGEINIIIWKFALVTWASFMAGAAATSTYQVTYAYGPDRFLEREQKLAPLLDRDAQAEGERVETESHDVRLIGVWAVLGLWIPLWCAFRHAE